MAVDLDALAAELTAAGYRAEVNALGIKLSSRDGHKIGWVTSGAYLDEWSSNDWTAIDIIRRHVSPEPSRRAAVDVVMIPRYLAGRAASYAEYYASVSVTPNTSAADAAAIRAMLEGTA